MTYLPTKLRRPLHLFLISQLFLSCDHSSESGGGQGLLPPNHSWSAEASFQVEGTVMSVWGTDQAEGWETDTVYAVGGQPEKGLLWQRVQGQWGEVSVPAGALLNWIHGKSGHVWIVGNGGRALRMISSKAGGTGEWQAMETGLMQDLWGVWVNAPDDVWTVGGDPVGEGEPDPILAHFDGEQWEKIVIPPLDRSGVRALFKIYGGPQGSLFAVGMKGVIIGDLGDGWAQQPVVSSGGAPTVSEDFVSLWGSHDDLVAVGGRTNGAIARWDGNTWQSTILAGVPGLNGIWMDEQGDATLVGTRGAALILPKSQMSAERERSNETLVLHACWGRGQEIWAVGGSLNSSPPWEGVILHTHHRSHE